MGSAQDYTRSLVIWPQGRPQLSDFKSRFNLQIRNRRLGEFANLARLKCRDWQAIAKQDAVRGERGSFWSRCENALQIQRIRSAEREQFAIGRCFANRTQQA